MMDISFSQIQMFLAVAENESITQAAQKLNLTQSAVSKNLKYMEDTIGRNFHEKTFNYTYAGIGNEF